MSVPNFDALINQVDSIQSNICANCAYLSYHIIKLSCNHQFCLDCCHEFVKNDQPTCPKCQTPSPNDFRMLVNKYLSNPVNKLSYLYNISLGSTLWAYTGRNQKWLYSKEILEQIEAAYIEFVQSTDETLSQVEIEIIANNNPEIYVIDFNDMVQYPKNVNHKYRKIIRFTFKTGNELERYNIVGIAGRSF